MAGLESIVSGLNTAWRALDQRWNETKLSWQDGVQREFEKQHWNPLEQQVKATEKEMDRLAQVISAARRSVK